MNTLTHPSFPIEPNGWVHYPAPVPPLYALQDFWFHTPLLFEHMSGSLCSNCGLTFNADGTALVRAKTAPCDLVTSFTDPLMQPDEQPAHEVWYTLAEGKHWCLNHKRPATHVDRRGRICCDPKLGGIMIPCDTRPIL